MALADKALHGRFAQLMATRPPRVILGSASASRRAVMDELVQQHTFIYEVVTADIDEKAIRHAAPEQLVCALAHAKADAIMQRLQRQGNASFASTSNPDANRDQHQAARGYLLTCDQVVVCNGVILEKPESAEEARAFITGYALNPASTVGSVVCTDLQHGTRHEELEVCTIFMDPLPPDTIEALIAEGSVFACAGALRIEHPLVAPHITHIDGAPDSVMGLGKAAVMRLLLKASGM